MPEPERVGHHHSPEEDVLPARLAEVGYRLAFLKGVEVILPPVCDIPAGRFLMGSDPARDGEAGEDEQPQRWVTLPTFQIATFPVTVAEYACFARATGRAAPAGEDGQPHQVSWQTQLRERRDHPVVGVSWRDARAYARWLARYTRQPWRLPTEAEWEKAARGTDGRIYPWGDTFDAGRCNTREGARGGTTPVGSYPSGASPCGAQDIAGNVWEWTSSIYKPYPYNATDGRERVESRKNRVLRGSSWGGDAGGAHAAFRFLGLPDFGGPHDGFRLVCAAPIA